MSSLSSLCCTPDSQPTQVAPPYAQNCQTDPSMIIPPIPSGPSNAPKDSPQDSNTDAWNHKLGLLSANPKTATSLAGRAAFRGLKTDGADVVSLDGFNHMGKFVCISLVCGESIVVQPAPPVRQASSSKKILHSRQIRGQSIGSFMYWQKVWMDGCLECARVCVLYQVGVGFSAAPKPSPTLVSRLLPSQVPVSDHPATSSLMILLLLVN